MANPRETFEPDTIYHIYNHGNSDDLVFREDENYRFFFDRFRKYISPIARVYAYCLMPNHFHFLIRVKDEEELGRYFEVKGTDRDLTGFENLSGLISRQFSNFFNSYSKSFNKLYKRNGRLFKSSLERIAIRDDEYFTNMIRYIHFNPVLHGFTSTPEEWKFNSIHSYYSEQRSTIRRQEVFEWFGGTENFEKFHKAIQDDEFVAIKHLTLE